MPTRNPLIVAMLLIGSFIAAANAQMTAVPPNEKDAINIIATYDDINPTLYRIIHITPGRQQDQDGFVAENVVRITAFAPGSAGRPKREIKHYLLQYDEEYGWYIELTQQDTRGIFIEISSQKKGRVIVR